MTARDTLRTIRDELAQLFLERSEVIDGALTALLSRHHILLIGPPGSAKSMLADELCRRLEGATYFQWLLTKFTTPEELKARNESFPALAAQSPKSPFVAVLKLSRFVAPPSIEK